MNERLLQQFYYALRKEQTRNAEVLVDFIKYCLAHPQERFWQALRNWSGKGFIYASEQFFGLVHAEACDHLEDTWNWEKRNG